MKVHELINSKEYEKILELAKSRDKECHCLMRSLMYEYWDVEFIEDTILYVDAGINIIPEHFTDILSILTIMFTSDYHYNGYILNRLVWCEYTKKYMKAELIRLKNNK